jgi:hypothetical protein
VAQSPLRSPNSPARRYDGAAINVAVDVTYMAVEKPHQSDDDEDDDSGDGAHQYMLLYDPRPGVFNLAHSIEEAREEGDNGNSDEECDEVLLHGNAHL